MQRSFAIARVLLLVASSAAVAALGGCGTVPVSADISVRFCIPSLLEIEGRWRFGEPIADPPPGLMPKPPLLIQGYEIEIYCDPSGTVWARNPITGEFYPILSQPAVPGGSGPTGTEPFGRSDPLAFLEQEIAKSGFLVCRDDFGSLQELPIGPAELAFDLKLDTASLEFVLPPDMAEEFIDPALTDYSATLAITELLGDGSLWVRYEGTPNGVLGAAMVQGLTRIEREEPLVGTVTVELKLEYSAAFFYVDDEPYEDMPFHLIHVEPAKPGAAGSAKPRG